MNTHYQVLFAGVSSEAVAAIEQSPDIYDLQKLLLINPPFTISLPKVKKSLEAKKDATFNFVFWSNDPSYRFLPLLDNVKSQSSINLKIVEGAVHNFKGMESEFKGLFINFVENNLTWLRKLVQPQFLKGIPLKGSHKIKGTPQDKTQCR